MTEEVELKGWEAFSAFWAKFYDVFPSHWGVRAIGKETICIENDRVQISNVWCKRHKKMELVILYVQHPKYLSYKQNHGFVERE